MESHNDLFEEPMIPASTIDVVPEAVHEARPGYTLSWLGFELFQIFLGSNKEFPIYEKFNLAKLDPVIASSFAPSSGQKFQKIDEKVHF